MTRVRRHVALLVLAGSAVGSTGCFTVAKQAYREVRGAQGEYLPISEPGAAALAQAGELQFKPATTSVGSRICPPEVLRAYDLAAAREFAAWKTGLAGSGRSLTVESEVMYFQAKNLSGGAIMLTRVRLLADGQLAADGLLKAESHSFRAGGHEDLARVSLEALHRHLQLKRQPPRVN